MKKTMKKTIAFILMICTLALSMVSCDFAGIFNKNTDLDNSFTPQSSGLEYGFKLENGNEETPIHFCAYRCENNTFDIDDVTLIFYFGVYYFSTAEYHIKSTESFPSFEIYFTNDDNEMILMKKVDENFISEKYHCELIYGENHSITEVKYNYSETFTIPKKIFNKETGRIYFAIYGINATLHEPTVEWITGVGINYKVTNGKVTLSNKNSTN